MGLPEALHLAAGREVLLGRFEVEQLLGTGGFGAVYRAEDLALQRPVALKVLPRQRGGSEPTRRHEEVRLLSTLNHPALVALYEVFDIAERTVLVMELVEGPTLRALLDEAPLPPATVASVAVDLASALEHIHGRGIVHRDIKPSNVLVAERGEPRLRVKLSDFGIATGATGDSAAGGAAIGTARFVSPEQARGGEIGPASDIYSLGLTLLAAIAGPGAEPSNPADVLRRRILLDPAIPRTLDYGWRSLLTSMTARSPAFRPSAAEVLERAGALADSDQQPERGAAPEEQHTMPLDILRL